MSQYLKQRGTGTIYIATPEMLKRKDMDPYEPEPVIPKEKEGKKPKKGKTEEAFTEEFATPAASEEAL